MKLSLKRILSALLLLILMLPILPAQAASQKAYVICNTLPVFSKASSSGKSIATMTYGESITVVSVNDDWATIKNTKGETGYCKVNYLSAANPNILNVKTATKGKTPVYDMPDDDSKVIYTCKKGSRVTVVGQTRDGDWYRVKNGSKYGYIEADDVNAIVWVNQLSTCALLSQYGGVSGAVSFGQAFEHISTEQKTGQKVCKIRNDSGKYAYIDYYSVTDENPLLDEPVTMYTQISGKILRKQIATKYGTKSISKNKAVTVLGYTSNGQTAYVKYDGKNYYINSIFLHTGKAPSGGRVLYVKRGEDDTTLHKKATFASDIVATVDGGDVVYLVGASSNGLYPQVKTVGGKTGYQVAGCFEASWQR